MKALDELCCQNSACPKYGQRGAGNLSVCGWIGRKRNIRHLYCSACKARFSERKGTVLYNAKLPPQKVIAILDHVREGCGVRQTGRLVGVSKNTANRYVLLAGRHAQALHDEVVAFSPSEP
jgi:transposase-like protein